MAASAEEELVNRLRELETSQAKLREQLGVAQSELERRQDPKRLLMGDEGGGEGGGGGGGGGVMIPGFFAHGPYRNVLHHLGHALHVCRPPSGEIIYWNQSAEHLYGWMDYEALGQRVADLIMFDESYPYLKKVIERLIRGQSWSGRFPLKKRSGEVFTAMVTKSPLYEDGELVGVITVSSDLAVVEDMGMEELRTHRGQARDQPRECKLNFKRVHWPPQPQISSSVLSLASKIFPRNAANCDIEDENPRESCECVLRKENVQSERRETSAPESISISPAGRSAIGEKYFKCEETLSKFNQRTNIAAKMFAKLDTQGGADRDQVPDKGIQTDSENISPCSSINREGAGSSQDSQPISVEKCTGFNAPDAYVPKEGLHSSNLAHGYVDEDLTKRMRIAEFCAKSLPKSLKEKVLGQWKPGSDKSEQCSDDKSNFLEKIGSEFSNGLDRSKDEVQQIQEKFKEDLSPQAALEKKHASQEKAEDSHSSGSTISVETTSSSQASASACEEKDSTLVADCGIHWEDLLLAEEIGQGFYAVVYRGIWNGSDVAIKVYLGKDYSEKVLLDYKKEVTIMKRLRHPNVLLFMGAVHSPDRLAIVTELLQRGSLFRTLHKTNQALDMKRRLRMALDVARGMNYLHRRKPPIIHRDLKSSNLLVDKNWTVKVGDFGLSCLKISTFLTAKSGRGTPQWMAPEVLRGECTSERSDVFSFGVVLWELMTEAVPWSHLNPLQVVGVVGFMDRRLDLPEGLDPRVSSIISDCWESDPGRRPSFEDIMGRMAGLTGAAVATAPAHRRPGHQMRGCPSDC